MESTNNKESEWLKAGFASLLILMMTFSVTGANNQTIEFEAFDGTVDKQGDLVKGNSNVQDYKAVVYDFNSSRFSDADTFYTKKSTEGSNITLNFNISDTEKRKYGIYFYKRNSNDEDEYITYEYTVELNKTGENLDEINSKHYSEQIYFTKKTGAESNIRIDQFDELAAGDPVTVGVDIEVDAPIEQTYVTNYTPNKEFGEVNLTEFYKTDVQYDLEAVNLTTGSANNTVDAKTDTVSLEFGESEYLNFTTIDKTGYYNITGETNPTVDSKVDSGTNSSDYEEVRYLSKIDSYAKPNEAFTRSNPFETELYVRKDTFSNRNEADILEKFEYTWIEGKPLDGENGLDAASSTTNVSFDNSQESLPVNLSKSEEGDWYFCHRAWVEDTRSFITKGKTSCNHYMIDSTSPVFSQVSGPTGNETYKEDGFTFNATVSDNVQLNNVKLDIEGVHEKSFNIGNNTDPNKYIYTYKLDASDRPYSYSWTASDRVDNSKSTTSQSFDVDPLSTNADIKVLNSSDQADAEFGLMENATLEVTTGTSKAPVDIDSNTSLAAWSNVTNAEGSYTQELSLKQEGIFKFNVSAGEGDSNYVDSDDQVKINVSSTNGGKYTLTFNETLQDQEIVKGEKFSYQANTSYNGTDSNLTWNVRNSNFTATSNGEAATITNTTNLPEGEYEIPVEVYDGKGTYLTETFNLTVNPALHWSTEPKDQSITEGERFSIDLTKNVGYIGDKSNLTWTTNSNKNLFTASNGVIQDTQTLGTGTYTVGVKVSDKEGREASTRFELTVNEETSSGGGGGGSSGGGGGGGSFGGLGSANTERTPVRDRVSFDSGTGSDGSYNFDTSTGEGSITLNFQEDTTLNLSATGGLVDIIELPQNVTGTANQSADLKFNITEPTDTNQTSFTGNITLKDSENAEETLNIPLTIERDIKQEEISEELDLRIGVFSDQTLTNGSFQYSVRVRNAAETQIDEQATVTTTLTDKDGTVVYETEETTMLGQTLDYTPENIEAGEQKLETTVDIGQQTFTDERTLVLREDGNRLTGGFFSSTSSTISDAIKQLVDGVAGIFG